MRKVIQLVLLSVAVLLGSLTVSHVDGAVLRANEQGEGDERQAALNNNQADLERELRRRRGRGGDGDRDGGGTGRRGGGGGKGKGGKGMGGGSKSAKGRAGGKGIRFLPDHIEPIPFVNCIPLPPGFLSSKSRSGSGSGSKGSKGKGKGKGNRRQRRSDRRGSDSGGDYDYHRNLKHHYGGMHHHHRHQHDGRIRHGRNRGHGNRMGGRHGGGTDHHHHPHMHHKKMGMMMGRLPFCPPSAPTLFPTSLPSFTPFPTATPLPSITPFPSFTPFPTGEETEEPGEPTDRPAAPTDAPDTPTVPGAPTEGPDGPGDTPAPVVAGAPTTTPAGGAPVAIPDGTTRILVESTLEYRFFDGVTPREPTQEELDGVMVETTRFYNDILSAAFPNLNSFDATFVSSSFDAAATLPVLIDFDANAFFTDGTDIPTAAEVFSVLEGADYQDYIQNYVWNSEPQGTTIFFETQEVAYNARVTTGLPA